MLSLRIAHLNVTAAGARSFWIESVRYSLLRLVALQFNFRGGTNTINLKTEFQAGLYRHYKGNDYIAYGIARHSETEEQLVVYTPLKSKLDANNYPTGNLWVRPLSMFNETVDTGEQSVPRFAFISELDAESKVLTENRNGLSLQQRIQRFFSRTSS